MQQPMRGIKGSFAYMQQGEYKPKKARKRGRKEKEREDASMQDVYMMAGPSNANVILDSSRDSENDWAIRVGQGSTPDWAKTTTAFEESEESSELPYKRNKPKYVPNFLGAVAISLTSSVLSSQSRSWTAVGHPRYSIP